MDLVYEMDLACTAALTERERRGIPGELYDRILGTCAAVAQQCADAGARFPVCPPRPPGMQLIRALLAVPGDYVWRDDLSFDVIESVAHEDFETILSFRSGRLMTHTRDDYIRVAIKNSKAAEWNQERAAMDDDTLRAVAADYGAF